MRCLALSNLHHAIEAFLEMMAAERGASGNTLEAYRRDLEDFSTFLLTKQVNLTDASTKDIQAYIGQLAAIAAPSTRARKLSAIKQYYLFLYSDGMRTDNPAAVLDTPKLAVTLPNLLSKEEVSRLLSFAAEDQTPKGLRLYTMLEVLYASGLRVSELVTLKLSHLQKEQGQWKPYLLIKGKGGKERIVPLNVPALEALSRFIPARSALLKSEETAWLFPSYTKDGKPTHLTRQRFAVLIKALAMNAGISPDKVSPHALRHSFASHLIENGANLSLVQELLGHSSITTTQIYTHILNDRMKTLVLDHHPLKKA